MLWCQCLVVASAVLDPQVHHVLICANCNLFCCVQRLADATKKLETAQASLKDAMDKLKEVSLSFHFVLSSIVHAHIV